MKLAKRKDDGAAINKFYGLVINSGKSAAGKLSEYGVYSAYALSEGRTLADAYNDMGGITFNVANLGVIADIIATNTERTNATGQGNIWSKLAENLSGMGILELNIGTEGITASLGTDGFDLAGSVYDLAKRLDDKATLEAYMNQTGISEEQAQTAWLSYIYGDRTQENTAIRIAEGTDELKIVKELANGKTAYTTQNSTETGRIITMLSAGNDHQNAVQLGHEAYRDGIVSDEQIQKSETLKAVAAHTNMAMTMLNFGQTDVLNYNIIKDIIAFSGGAEMFTNYVNENYDSSADYWKVNEKGNLYWDGQFDLVDENGNLLEKANSKSLYASYAQFKGISVEEAKKLFESDELNVSFREGKLLSYNSETGKFDIDRTNDSSFDFETSDKFKASYDFQVNYADKVLEKYNGDMVAALQDYQFNSLMGNTLVSSQIVATMMSGLYDFADSYNDSMQAYGNVGKTKATSQMFNEIAADFDAGIFSNDNAFFKYAKDISPVVGDNRVVSDYYYSDKSLHVKNPDALAIDFGTFGKTAGIVTTQNEIILTNSSFGYTEKGGFNISTYTDLFKKRYVHMQDKSSAYIMLNSLNNSAKTANIWRYSLPSNYQIGNVAGFNDTYAHGSAWEAPHSHTEYTRLK